MKPSAWAIVVLIIVVILLFGASKLPELAGSIGTSLKIFKREVKDLQNDSDVSSYTATGGQPPQTTYPPYPGSQPVPGQQPPGGPAGDAYPPGGSYPPAGEPYPPTQPGTQSPQQQPPNQQ